MSEDPNHSSASPDSPANTETVQDSIPEIRPPSPKPELKPKKQRTPAQEAALKKAVATRKKNLQELSAMKKKESEDRRIQEAKQLLEREKLAKKLARQEKAKSKPQTSQPAKRARSI